MILRYSSKLLTLTSVWFSQLANYCIKNNLILNTEKMSCNEIQSLPVKNCVKLKSAYDKKLSLCLISTVKYIRILHFQVCNIFYVRIGYIVNRLFIEEWCITAWELLAIYYNLVQHIFIVTQTLIMFSVSREVQQRYTTIQVPAVQLVSEVEDLV